MRGSKKEVKFVRTQMEKEKKIPPEEAVLPHNQHTPFSKAPVITDWCICDFSSISRTSGLTTLLENRLTETIKTYTAEQIPEIRSVFDPLILSEHFFESKRTLRKQTMTCDHSQNGRKSGDHWSDSSDKKSFHRSLKQKQLRVLRNKDLLFIPFQVTKYLESQ